MAPRGKTENAADGAAALRQQLDQRTRELAEAAEQQAAVAEILRVISNSPGDVKPVFDAVARHAARICEAPFADIIVVEAGMIRNAANVGALGPSVPNVPLDRTTFMGRSICDRQTLHVADLQSPDLDFSLGRQLAIKAGAHTALAVPLIRDDRALGTILVRRTEVRPFEDKHIALLKTFADQAAIAIENARLLNELRQRTDDLTESLEQQTATSEVLRVISSSPGELQPVFETMLSSATRICDAQFSLLWLAEGDRFRSVAFHNLPAAYAANCEREPVVSAGPGTVIGRARLTKQAVQVEDITAEPAYRDRDPVRMATADLGGARTLLGVPLLKDDEFIGVIAIYRKEARLFNDKQVELVENFAAQAVIAIENTRLLSELRQRTDELAGSLEQQTATSEILASISGSMTDTKPVFEAIVRNLLRLFGTGLAMVQVLKDGMIHLEAASSNVEFEILKKAFPQPLDENSGGGRAMIAKRILQFAPVSDDPAAPPLSRRMARELGFETVVFAPMMRGELVFGAIATARPGSTPFSEQEVELITTFADQAVIAIENARLLKELRQRTDDLSESLEQQTAISDILRVISNSPGNLQPVFDTVAERAARICEAQITGILIVDDGRLRVASAFGDLLRPIGETYPLDRSSTMGRSVCDKQTVHLPDALNAGSEYPLAQELALRFGHRTTLAVPLIREDRALGTILVRRTEVRPFEDKHIVLLKTFADQAAIAIENTRLLNELRQRTDDLSESLEQQTATSEVLKVVSSSPGDLKPVFDAMLENATRVCNASSGTMYLREPDGLRTVAMHNVKASYSEVRKPGSLVQPPAGSLLGRALSTKQVQRIDDLRKLQSYVDRDPFVVAAVDLGGYRTAACVPMLRDTELIGAITLSRAEVRPFADKQIELVQNFAAQAVIAIENARLLNEVRQQASQLEAQSQELRTLNQGLEQRVDEQVGEIERIGRLRRFLPPQVADLIVSSGAEKQLESHRREITALFCDLRGFTGFSETSDPEDVMALLREYHKAIGEIIFRHGGTLERFAGDGVMVIFGDPVPLENPALAAVQMALEMRAAITALIERWRRLGHDLGFGIGISHGFATLGTIGFEGRFDYAAIGTVSNVASRLCDEAEPGQILISPRVLMAVENAVTVAPVGEKVLKGIRRPVPVNNVTGASEAKDDRDPR